MRGLQLEVYYVVVDKRFYVFSRVIDFILCSANIIMPYYAEYKVFKGVFYYAAVIVDISIRPLLCSRSDIQKGFEF